MGQYFELQHLSPKVTFVGSISPSMFCTTYQSKVTFALKKDFLVHPTFKAIHIRLKKDSIHFSTKKLAKAYKLPMRWSNWFYLEELQFTDTKNTAIWKETNPHSNTANLKLDLSKHENVNEWIQIHWLWEGM